jgi:crotonobetainyl-CoA:carnitine CoA-transferase CaiB-like acyl-CoA transferase
LVANPIRMSQTPVDYRHAPPMLGQHTREVLSEVLGMTEDSLNDLKQQGVFG